MNRIYLDANATTPLHPQVFEAMRPFLLESFGNASSTHLAGQRARAAVEHARDALSQLLHCRASELVFTSGGTESDNMALFGTVLPGQHLVTSTAEHHAVLHAAQALAKQGVDVTFLPCAASGLIDPEALRTALRPNTRLVSLMMANNETGVIQPIAQLARVARQHVGADGVPPLFHTDAVQAAGKLPVDLTDELREVDLLSISGHKMYAPQGTGVLFVRRKTALRPMFHGGPHERARRAGTENVAGIVALGRAAELAADWMAATDGTTSGPAQVEALRDRLENGVLRHLPDVEVNGAGAPRTPNTCNLAFDKVDAEALLIALDLRGVAVSAGSACQSGATEPSHVLLAMGFAPVRARSSVRFSLSRFTTEAEIDRTIEGVSESVQRQRTMG
jgi:cysteine desulfurase